MVDRNTADNVPTLRLAHLPGSMSTVPPASGATGPSRVSASAPIHVATINVRYDGRWNNPVPIPNSGAYNPPALPSNPYAEQAWAVRRSRLVDALLSTGHLDIIGFQEVLHNQLHDLEALLGPRFGHVGVGRDDGKTRGEYSPIFYDQTRFELVDWKTVWLSKTPIVPGSVGWDASQTRIATLLTVKENEGGALVHAVCTHYDDQGVKARAHSSLLIRTAVAAWIKEVGDEAGDSPVLLFGDFNSPASEDGYKNITSRKPLPEPSLSFLDAYRHLRARDPSNPGVQSRPYGPAKTYTGFAAPGREKTTRIDFIMLGVQPDDKVDTADTYSPWAFTQYAVVDNWVEEEDADGWAGRWSDHRAVLATLERV